MRRISYAVVLLAWACLAAADERPVLLTGEVFSQQAQEIIVPLTNNWQARISVMAPEGSFVDKGDVVVEFDGTEAARQLEQQQETARADQARTERDVANLQKDVALAEFQLKEARVDLQLASLKADVPSDLVGKLEYSENQLAKAQATKALDDATLQLADKRKSLAARQKQAHMDDEKTRIQEHWWKQMLDSFVVRASQPGYVIYGNHPWTRAKFQEGDNVQTSFWIAQVANTSDLAIRVWINGVDKPHIAAGAPVKVEFDALPERSFTGVLQSVSDSGAKRAEWGKAVYFEGIVKLDKAPDAALMPGMSALVEVGS